MRGVCIFCEKIRQRDYETDYPEYDSVGFTPLDPVVPGHRLFVPKHHVIDAAEDPTVTALVFGAAALYARDMLSDLQSFNLITNAGKHATQTIEHLHVHLVPRDMGDGLLLPWSGQRH